MSRPVWRWTLLVWAVVTALGAWGLVAARRADLRAAFDLDARILHRVMSQRLEQQETVLYAVAALSDQGMDPGRLNRYVQTLIHPYPQIVAAQVCIPAGCQVLASGHRPLPRLPFSFQEQPAVNWLAGEHPLYALTLRGARVWVDAQALLVASDLPREPLSVQIYRPDSGERLTGQATPAGRAAFTFSAEKQLGTRLEPFPVRFARTHSWQVWPWGRLAAWSILTMLVALGVVWLLTVRGRTHQALLDERRRAQGVVQASTDGIVVLDPQGAVVQVNPAARLIVGELRIGAAVQDQVQVGATLSQAPLDTAQFWSAREAQAFPEGTALQRNGQRILVEGGLTPLLGERGQLLGRVLTVREVGPLRQRLLARLDAGERRVREHEQMLSHVSRLSTLGEMSAGLAHELTQPLTAIVSYGQAGTRLLGQDPPDLPRARQAVQGMVTQAQRSAQIIARLRTLVRRAPAQRVQVDVVQAVHNILTLCQADLSRLAVTVETQFPVAAPALGDPVQVEQIILNLVRNALEAMDEAGECRLDLRIEAAGDWWRLTVQDSGAGLSGETLARLFQPFQTSKPGGLGLGLSLSQTLAQGLGGELTGANAPGRGARFVLTLPQWSGDVPAR